MWQQQRDRGRSSWQGHRPPRGRHIKPVRNPADTSSTSQQPLPQTTELNAKTPLLELQHKIKSLGFPQSCNCVLGLLDKHFKATIAGDIATKNSLPNRETLLFLVKTFVLCLPQGKKYRDEASLSPLQELQLLEELRGALGEKESIEHCYCIFDALFGRNGSNADGDEDDLQSDEFICSSGRHKVLYKLLSLSVSLERGTILSCVAVWMKNHPREALHLALALYEDFCVMLPNAGDPLFRLAAVSPHIAYQLTQVFTTLHPIYRGRDGSLPGAPTTEPHPPIQLVQLISHWVESSPEFLHQQQAIEGLSDLPLMHPQTVQSSIPSSKSPLAGLVQWCVVAPLASLSNASGRTDASHGTLCGTDRSGQGLNPNSPTDASFDRLMAELHVKLLSVVLSRSVALANWAFTTGDLCVIVSAVVGYSRQVADALPSEMPAKMDECMERLAQFLQIAHATGVVTVKAEELSQITSSLPSNRLLSLFIERHKQI
eukprot:Em0020g884a